MLKRKMYGFVVVLSLVLFPLSQLAVAPPGLAVTVYAMICDPPLETGARHVTTA